MFLQFDEVEVCVHVDGSTDGTLDSLKTIADNNGGLLVTADVNRGIAYARKRALLSAGGKYSMLFDDDDQIDLDGFRQMLARLREGTEPGTCGFVFQMRHASGDLVGGRFPRVRTNFLQLRWDDAVQGDKKEVVETALLRPVIYPDYPGVRFVPAGLMWTRVAIDHDVCAVNTPVGIKNYLEGGLSKHIRGIIFANPKPMVDLYAAVVTGFLRGRCRSPIGFVRAFSRLAFYWFYDRVVFSALPSSAARAAG